VSAQRGQAQHAGVAMDHLDRSVPRSRHLDHQVIADLQFVRSDVPGVDVDHFGGNEFLEITNDPVADFGDIEVGCGYAYAEHAMEQAAVAVWHEEHPDVDDVGRQRQVTRATPQVNYSIDKVNPRDWNIDVHRNALPAERPGPPEPEKSWEQAFLLVRDCGSPLRS
jgi:hypothetical protein